MGDTLKTIAARGIETGPDTQMPDVEIPEFDPRELLEMQAVFGHLVHSNPQINSLINATGPTLFAALLFTICEEYEIDPTDDESVIATKSVVEAESKAIGLLRGVANAMGKLEGELTTEPSEAEVDADTDINPVT